MACRGYEARLMDEAAATATDAELAAHLESCAACREELAAQRALQERISSGIAQMTNVNPSPAVLARVRKQIAAESEPRGVRWMQWAMAGTGVAALAAIAIWFGGRIRLAQPAAEKIATSSGPSVPGYVQSAVPVQAAQAGDPMAPATAARAAAAHRPRPTRTAKTDQPVIEAVDVHGPPVAPAEVLIPPGQREAVARLVNALRSGHVNAAALTEPPDFSPLRIAPLEITTLDAEKAASKKDGNQN
jgi:hypothetical protein